MATKPEALRRLLWPEAVAIIGASPTQAWTKHMLPSMRTLGYRGEAFLVNPQYKEVDGTKCYPNIRELPRIPDAVIVAVRRELAVDVVEECAERGVGGVVMITGGFTETGPDGQALEQRLCAIARRANIALLGPNCQGYVNCLQPSALWMDEFFEPLRSGGVAVISHSGSVSLSIMNHLYHRGAYTNYTVALGNESVVTAADLIGAFAEDSSVKVIAAYLETIRDPEHFFAACDRAIAADKPVVVMKVGRSPAAAEAVLAHTGALAGPDRIIDAKFRRHRIVGVRSLGEMVETCIAFHGRRITSPRLSVFASSGGHVELVVDAVASTALSFPSFAPKTAAKLCEGMPAFRKRVANNPFDTGGTRIDADTVGTLASDPDVDAVMFVTNTRRHPTGIMHPMQQLLSMAERLHDESGKPVVVLSANDDVEPSVGLRLASRGIPVIGGVEVGLQALENVYCYNLRPAPPLPPFDMDGAALQRRLNELRGPLAGQEALNLLADLGLTTVRSLKVRNEDDAVAAARKLGYPVVVKTGAEDVLHKSDTGQVFVNLATDDAVREAARTVKAPILVQPYLRSGVELIIGLQGDPELGICVAVGIGGIMTELLDTVTLRPVPLRVNEAAEMLSELPLDKILDGYRGSPPVDRGALTAAIERVASFGAAVGPAIRSLDLNPVIASASGAQVVDALVIPRNVAARE